MQSDSFDKTVFMEKFIGLPFKNLSPDPESLIDAYVAEALRNAIFYESQSKNGLVPVFSRKLINWAIRKTRALLILLNIEVESKVKSILSGEGRENLEFIGDIIRTPGGYYLPSISKAIIIREGYFALISGRPTSFFENLGNSIQISGVLRYISCNSDILQKVGIVIISKSDYLEQPMNDITPFEFLRDCSITFPKEKWIPSRNDQAYLGNSPNSHGFSLWGYNPIKVNIGDSRLSYWRTEVGFSHQYRLLMEGENDKQISIIIPESYYKRVCLALDHFVGSVRKATLRKESENITLGLNFAPPKSEMKWIFVIGGKWKGSIDNQIFWKFPTESKSEIMKIARNLWLDIKEGN